MNVSMFGGSERPVGCPNCKGEGTIERPYRRGILDKLLKRKTKATELRKCWFCDGKGVVWELRQVYP